VAGPVTVAVARPEGTTGGSEPVAASGGNAFDGGRGAESGKFHEPVGIAGAKDGTFYVADKGNHRIEKFARDGSFIGAGGEQGDQAGQFREPHDVAVDDEFVYVADTWNQRIQVFTRDGAHVFTITGEPSISSPRGVFVKDKLIYVAEAGGPHVSVYDRAGKRQRIIGTPGGEGPGHLMEPVDVAVDARGDVWVLNSGNNRIEHFGADGTPRGAVPIPGWTGKRLKEVSLAVGSDGTLYVGDWDRGGVRRFRPDGSELTAIGAGLRQPSGITFQPGGRVLVVSRGDDVVRVLEPEKGVTGDR
jgi:sugar lactone lactonase YvrE